MLTERREWEWANGIRKLGHEFHMMISPGEDKGKSEEGEMGEVILKTDWMEYTEVNWGTGRCRS